LSGFGLELNTNMKTFDKILDIILCKFLNIATGEEHAHFFFEIKEETESKNPDTYIWTF
jgi:hypothetical protein